MEVSEPRVRRGARHGGRLRASPGRPRRRRRTVAAAREPVDRALQSGDGERRGERSAGGRAGGGLRASGTRAARGRGPRRLRALPATGGGTRRAPRIRGTQRPGPPAPTPPLAPRPARPRRAEAPGAADDVADDARYYAQARRRVVAATGREAGLHT